MATKKKTAEKSEPAARPAPDKIDPNPVEANEPYPTGSPRDPEDDFAAAHGYRRDQTEE